MFSKIDNPHVPELTTLSQKDQRTTIDLEEVSGLIKENLPKYEEGVLVIHPNCAMFWMGLEGGVQLGYAIKAYDPWDVDFVECRNGKLLSIRRSSREHCVAEEWKKRTLESQSYGGIPAELIQCNFVQDVLEVWQEKMISDQALLFLLGRLDPSERAFFYILRGEMFYSPRKKNEKDVSFKLEGLMERELMRIKISLEGLDEPAIIEDPEEIPKICEEILELLNKK